MRALIALSFYETQKTKNTYRQKLPLHREYSAFYQLKAGLQTLDTNKIENKYKLGGKNRKICAFLFFEKFLLLLKKLVRIIMPIFAAEK